MIKVSKQFIEFGFVNAAILAAMVVYLILRFGYLNEQIPLWYTLPWGQDQLAVKSSIFVIPIVAILITIGGFVAAMISKKEFMQYAQEGALTTVTGINLILGVSLLRIILIASKPFPPLVDPTYLKLVMPF